MGVGGGWGGVVECRKGSEGGAAPRRRPALTKDLVLPLSKAVPLIEGLAGSSRALLIRQLFQVFGFNERRPALWRLEHKLVQALVLNQLCPGVVPATSGLDFQFRQAGGSKFREHLEHRFPSGFVIKETLGDTSG